MSFHSYSASITHTLGAVGSAARTAKNAFTVQSKRFVANAPVILSFKENMYTCLSPFRAVYGGVLYPVCNLKIFYSVVIFNLVKMVDYFITRKFPSDMTLNDNSMFVFFTTIFNKLDVSVHRFPFFHNNSIHRALQKTSGVGLLTYN